MKYKLELITEDPSNLIEMLEATIKDLDSEYVAKIKSKQMGSIFFTRFANIHILDGYEEFEEE